MALSLSASFAAAQVVWDGGGVGGTDLSDPLNWAGDLLPNNGVAGTQIAQFNGSVAGPLSLSYVTANATMGGGANGGIDLHLTGAQTSSLTILPLIQATNPLRIDAVTIDAGAGAFTIGDGINGNSNVTLGSAVGQTHVWANNSTNAATISEVTFGAGGGGDHYLSLEGSGNWNVSYSAAASVALRAAGTGSTTINGNMTLAAAGNGPSIGAASLAAGVIPILNVTGGTIALSGSNNASILAGQFPSGTTPGTKGVINQSGGDISLTGSVFVGTGTASTSNYGVYNMTGGSITQTGSNRFRIGQATGAGSVAIFNNSGGTVTTTLGIALNDTVGASTGANGLVSLNVTGGSMTSTVGVLGSTTIGLGIGGRGGQSVATIAGTGSVVLNGQAVLGGSVAGTPVAADAGRVAVLNLGTGSTGGSLQASQVSQNATAGALPSGYLNFNGGTLKAQTANATFLNGLTRATVFSGGGTIDNNGVDITVGQALTAPSGSGVTSIAVSGATGYRGAPYVQITGGGTPTTPATAVANLDGSGNVTSITITNPGTGYTSAPTVALVGGGGAAGTLTPATGAVSSGGMTYTGFGKTTLSGASTYTGGTTISQGTVSVTGSLAGAVSVAGGKLDGTGTVGATTVTNDFSNSVANGNGGTGALTLASLGFAGAANMDVRSGATAGVVVTGNLSTTPANGTVTVNATNTTGSWANGLNNLVSYGTLSGGLAGFSLGSLNTPLNSRQFANGLVLNGNNIALSITGDNPKWTGLVSGEWSTNTIAGAKNWKLVSGGAATDYIEGDAVVFDDSAAGTTTIDITSSASPTSTVFNNSTKNYTIGSTGGGGISGIGGLTKDGTGSVTISANNFYAGPTTVNAGTLVLSGNNGTGGTTTLNAGTLTLSGSNSTIADTVINGGTFNFDNAGAIGSGILTLGAGTAKTLNNSSGAAIVNFGNNLQNWNDDFTFTGSSDLDLGTGAVTMGGAGTDRTVNIAAGVLSIGELKGAAHGLVKQGAGTLVLNSLGANANGSSLAGTLNVVAGTVQMNRTGFVGGDAATGDLFVTGLTGSGQVTNGAGEVRWLFVNQAAATTSTFAGTLDDGAGGFGMGLFKQGAGTLTLTGVSTLTDRVTVSEGTLNFTGAGSLANAGFYDLGTAGAIFQVDASTRINNAAPINIISTGAGAGANAGSTSRLELSGNTTLANPITFAPRNDTLGSDGIRSVSGNNTLSGLVTVVTGGNQTRFRSEAGSNLTLSGGITTTAGSGRNVYLQGDGNGEVSGVIADNAANVLGTIVLAKEGAGTWTLTGANTYTGTTTVTAGKLLVNGTNAGAGAVIVGATGVFGGTGSIGGNLDMIADGSTFAASFSGGTIDSLSVAGNVDLSSLLNTLTITGSGTGSSWDLINYTGTLTGTFESVTAGYTVDYATPGVIKLLAGGAGLPGDFNSDNKVDAADYTRWRDNVGSATALPNDGGLGTPIGPGHYTLWKNNFGATPSSGVAASAAVPEPATLVLVSLGLAFAAVRRGRRG